MLQDYTCRLFLLISYLAAPLALAESKTSLSSYTNSLAALYSQSPNNWPKATTADGVTPAPLAPLKPLKPMATESLIALGKSLFEDPILSRDNSVSCSSCHLADKHFADGKTTAVGIKDQVGTRNTPAIIGLDHWQSFFWDGRTATALEQALQPIENPIEMDLSITEALARLNQSDTYQAQFQAVFNSEKIEKQHLAQALVAFERSIDVPDTKFQRFIHLAYDKPQQAVAMLNEQELQGLHLFRTKAKCMTCHDGALLSDNEFHVTGFHFYGRRGQDLGRYEATGKVEDSGKFRTPSLLALTQTAPWMHTGLFIEFKPMIMQYNKGGFRPRRLKKYKDDPLFPETSPLIQQLHLTNSELDALVAFLTTL